MKSIIKKDSLLVSEIFYSLQGEGSHIGTPALFIRLAGCNLNCSYCDSSYTHDWKKYDKKKETVKLSIQEIIDIAVKIIPKSYIREKILVVITGGEPLLQKKGLIKLLDELRNKFHNPIIEIETNGTQNFSNEIDDRISCYSISPKLSNTHIEESKRIDIDILSQYLNSSYNDIVFKFIVSEKNNLAEIKKIQENLHLSPESIYVMPEGINNEDLKNKSLWIANTCLKERWNFSYRLQILLWGNERAK